MPEERSVGPSRRAVVAAALASFAPARSSEAGDVRLGAIAARAGVLYGAAIEPEDVQRDPAYAELIKAQCRLVTPENAMKWSALRPAPDAFDFRGADAVVSFAQAFGAKVRGHCLVWHESLPDWLSGEPARFTPALLQTHIATVVGRYRGRVGGWDVVNEWVERNDKRPDGLRASPWLQVMGPDYIALALRTAHAADPHARLILSDYGLEYEDIPWMAEKRATTLQHLAELKRAGVPLHGVGIQAHLLGDHPPSFGAGLTGFIRDLRKLGLDAYITELDVDDQNTPGGPAERDAAVARIYRAFLKRVLAEPNVALVNTWGLSDRYTSKARLKPRGDGAPVRPLPFDRDLAPKPAAFAIAQCLSARWG